MNEAIQELGRCVNNLLLLLAQIIICESRRTITPQACDTDTDARVTLRVRELERHAEKGGEAERQWEWSMRQETVCHGVDSVAGCDRGRPRQGRHRATRTRLGVEDEVERVVVVGHEAAQAREVEVILDVLLVDFAKELVALEAAEPLDPRDVLVLGRDLVRVARVVVVLRAALVALALALGRRHVCVCVRACVGREARRPRRRGA